MVLCVLSMENSEKTGIEHIDMFLNEGGGINYVFHTHNAIDKVHRTALAKARIVPSSGSADKLVIDAPSLYYLKTK